MQAQEAKAKGQRRDRGALRARRTVPPALRQAARPAVALACGMRSSRWLRCFSQSPVYGTHDEPGR
eukprot:2638093-Prymnesium_polylepis.2